MSTTYILESDPDPDADILDFMADLDRDLKADRSTKALAKKPVALVLPPVVQQWFPHRVVMHTSVQVCAQCTLHWRSVEGIFLQDIHRSGALQSKRIVGGLIPEDYKYLPYTQEEQTTTVAACPDCFNTPQKPELVAPAEPHRRQENEDA